MSSSIWTECGGVSELKPLSLDAWRVVEAQHQIATRRLVSSDAEQRLLEEMIDAVKPPMRESPRLHYLLMTPFRYPPLRNGSRFGTRHEPGIWYGSVRQSTAFAEVAYYRLLFLEGTHADLGAVMTELTAFRATIRTTRGIDLTKPPFRGHHADLTSPVSYMATQALGSAMRASDVAAFRFTSARDAAGGVNAGAFTSDVFGRRQPRSLETWYCTATRNAVEVARRDYFRRASFAFARAQFLIDGALPAPALS
jgi:hypothetical protein